MLWETIIIAFREIRRNLLRSSLTILGIIIGVSAVIAMVTLGKGATLKVTTDIAKLGSNMLFLRPGHNRHGPGGTRSAADMFDIKDAQAIAREVSGLAAIAPTSSQNIQAIFGNENWSTSIIGADNAYLQVRNWKLKTGREFTENELHSGKTVCILGGTVTSELFGSQDPLGAFIRMERLPCQVIGVLDTKGESGFGPDQDDIILIPLRTFQQRIAGDKDIQVIYISVQDGVSSEKVRRDIEILMRERRRIPYNEDDDFSVRDMKELVSTLTGTTKLLTALLGAVAAVSLLVGGIGIMNIMLVSVTERTREIGIRLAIGAREHEVLMQFLIEAVVLSSLGGLMGIIAGLVGAAIGARYLNVPFLVYPGIILIAFFFSGTIGVIFGYFPARRAARLNPIDALRHE